MTPTDLGFDNLSFGNIAAFYCIPLLIILYVLARFSLRVDQKNKALLLPSIFMSDAESEAEEYKTTPLFLLLLSFLMAIISLSMPRYGFHEVEQQRQGVDIVLAVDLSRSMNTEDVSPDRITIARRKVQDLLSILHGDRISLVSFAGISFVEAPLTLDYGVIKLLLDSLSTDMMLVQGSDLDALVLGASTSFKNVKANNQRSKALLILSDGEFDPETFDIALTRMKEENITPFLLAIGTEQGAPVPGAGGFKRDKAGKVVFSRSNIEVIAPSFKSLGGDALRYTSSIQDLRSLYGKIKNLQNTNTQTITTKKWNEYYQIPLAISVLFLLLAWLPGIKKAPQNIHDRFIKSLSRNRTTDISITKPKEHQEMSKNQALDSKSRYSIIILFIFSAAITYITPSQLYAEAPAYLNPSLESYNQGDFDTAARQLQAFKENGTVNYHLSMALGNTLYRMGRFSEALTEYSEASELATDNSEKAEALFNRGNALTHLNQFEEAITQYEGALKTKPEDKEIISNLSYVKKLINQQQNETKNEQENRNNKDQQNQSDSNKDDSNGSTSEEDKSNKNNNEHQNSNNTEREENNENKQDPLKNEPNSSDSEDKEEKTPESSQEKQENNNDTDKQNSSQQEEESEQGKPENKNSEKEQKNDQNEDNKSSSENQLPQHELLDHLLDALDENTSARAKFRNKKAQEELKKYRKNDPDMDW